MTKKFNRRRFILSATLSSISLYVGGWWFFKARHNDTADLIAALVQKHLHYLQIDEDGLQKFAQEYDQFLRDVSVERLSWLGMFKPLYLYTNWLDSTDVVAILGEHAASVFLMSSDFFWHNSDQNRVVKYRGIYHPSTGACANPFAQLEDG
ncbi:MAG: hypothetical protein AAF629_26260 [Chloroflexota bacterium]